MPTMTLLVRLGTAVLVAAAFVAIGGLMLATFTAFPDHSGTTELRWGLLALWTLVVPPAWGYRLWRRLGRLVSPSGDAARLRAALSGV